jgi:transposase-like protein
MFPDEESARVYLEGRIWPSGPICPACGSGEHISSLGTCATRKPGFYRCLPCGFDFTVRTNTVMERSKVPLHKWLYSMYLLVTARKGISSLQLAKEIGVTQKTAWFILGRLREACGGPDGPLDKLRGEVEIDECFVGGLESNKHEWQKKHAGRGPVGKEAHSMKPPSELDQMADAVLRYRPKPKSKAARKRAKKAAKKGKG